MPLKKTLAIWGNANMPEFSVTFNSPGFLDYPRTFRETVSYVAFNAKVDRPNVNELYIKDRTIPGSEYQNRIWAHTPQTGDYPTNNLTTPALRRYASGVWYEFGHIQRGDVVLVANAAAVFFPWASSGDVLNLSEFGEGTFTVPSLPSAPTGFKYKYYVGARISEPPVPPAPVITLP
jgi:hypothetical protein